MFQIGLKLTLKNNDMKKISPRKAYMTSFTVINKFMK